MCTKMEDVRLLVQEEGREARNLIVFNVPVEPTVLVTGKTITRKPPTSPRPASETKRDDISKFIKRTHDSPKPGSRVRSASTGRDKKSELQARHWAFLFGNLQRAVDEIYQTCESDENISECKEVILVLENYTKDFHSLIEWFHLKWDYETTPPPLRPTSLAWEIRKTSPGKTVNNSTLPINSHSKILGSCVSSKIKILNGFSCNKEKENSVESSAEVSAEENIPSKSIVDGSSKVACTNYENMKESSSCDVSKNEISTPNDSVKDSNTNLPKNNVSTNEAGSQFLGENVRSVSLNSVDKISTESSVVTNGIVDLNNVKKEGNKISAESSVVTNGIVDLNNVKKEGNKISAESSVVTNGIVDLNNAKKEGNKQSDEENITSHDTEVKRVSEDTEIVSNISTTKDDLHVNELNKVDLSDADKLKTLTNNTGILSIASTVVTECSDPEDKTESLGTKDLESKTESLVNEDLPASEDMCENNDSESTSEKNKSTQDAAVNTACDFTCTINSENVSNVSVSSSAGVTSKDIYDKEPEENEIVVQKAHQASQTDLEYCIEESGVLTFYPVLSSGPPTTCLNSPPIATTSTIESSSKANLVLSASSESFQPKTVTTPVVSTSSSTPVTRSLVRANTSFASTASAFVAVMKSSAASGRTPISFRSPAPATRYVTRVTAASPSVSRPATRPPYSAVSKFPSGPSNPRGGPATAPLLTRSRTSADVRSAIRCAGMPNRRPTGEPTAALRSQQKSVLVSRQNRMNTGVVSQAATSKPASNIGQRTQNLQHRNHQNVPFSEKRASFDYGSGSNLSVSSTASSQQSRIEKTKAADPNTAESVEVLARMGSTAEDDDNQGWETVKGRSRSRISPLKKMREPSSLMSGSSGSIRTRLSRQAYSAKTRFNQPSSAMSLPALSLAEVEVCPPAIPKQKRPSPLSSTNIAKDKKDMRDEKSARTVRNYVHTSKNVNRGNVEKGSNNQEKSNNIKNKLKTKEKINTENKENENRINVPSTITVDDITNEKLNDVLSNHDIKTESSQLECDCDGMSPEDSNKLDELLEEKALLNDKQNKELCEEVAMLQKEIQELETSEIEVEVDTETDDTETDGEAAICLEDGDIDNDQKPIFDENVSLEVRYENELQGMSWADQMDTLQQLEELVARHPGRALELHQKLSSPSRRRPLHDEVRRLHNKQAKAKEKRERLMLEKTSRLRDLLNKVNEVKAQQAQCTEEKRTRLEMKLKRAEMNRNLILKGIIRKAHDEDEKVKEITFINELEAQNKRHDFMTSCQEQEERLQGIHEGRQRKQEENAAKEAAAEERRKALEAERQKKLEIIKEERRRKDERIGRTRQEKEIERQNIAREKAKDRENRLSALNAERMANAEELQKKIQQKQEDSARRHEENIENIRHRAVEFSILRCNTHDEVPKLAPYDTKKLCQLCNVLIGSEVYLLSHLRGQKHQDMLAKQMEEVNSSSKEDIVMYNLKFIVDAPADKIDPKIMLDKERQKALKKRCKKLKIRMASRGQEYENSIESSQKVECPNKVRLQKCIKDVDKLYNSQGKGQWPNNAITSLERALGEMNRILNKQNSLDQLAFRALNGFASVSNILLLGLDVPPNMPAYLPPKCFVTACTTFSHACRESVENSKFVLLTNKVSTILDLLHQRLVELTEKTRTASPTSSSVLPADPIAGSLMRLLAEILNHATEGVDDNKQEIWSRVQDVISYAICVGIVDKLAFHCARVRDPIDGDPPASQFLLGGIELLTTLAARCAGVRRGNHDDPTQLVATLQVTELVGGVSMLYGMLLHQGAPARGAASPPPSLPSHTVAVTTATIRLMSQVAQLDLHMFQSVLGAEGISLQFRHIASYLLWYCSHDQEKELLHEVIRVVGYFAVNNHDNQMMIQSGYMPTVLQQLCNLPFPYFSNPSLSVLLFPTLLACCSGNKENRAILEQEVSYQLLEDFRKTEAGKNDPLVSLLSEATNPSA